MTCPRCTKEQDHGGLCWDCIRWVSTELMELEELVGELETQVTRQSSRQASVGSSGHKDESPILFDQRAGEVLDEIAQWVTRYSPRDLGLGHTRMVRIRLGLGVMRSDIITLARDPDVDAYVTTLGRVKARALGAIDSRPPLEGIGPCPECKRDRRVRAGQDVYACPCGRQTDVSAARALVSTRARNVTVTAKQVEAMGPLANGKAVRAATIRQWASRGKIKPVAQHSVTRENMFRFGDILDLAG